VKVEHYWLDGQFDRLPALMADLVRRPMAVIATLQPCCPGGQSHGGIIIFVISITAMPVGLC
jgi:hypothetical protein